LATGRHLLVLGLDNCFTVVVYRTCGRLFVLVRVCGYWTTKRHAR